MRELLSGLDAWRFIVRSNPGRKRLETYLPLLLSIVGVLGVFPFAVLRFLQGQWVAAIIDTIIVCGLLTLGIYVYRTRRVRLASAALSVLCMGGVIATVYLIGPHQVYWAYPALMAMFYLLRPRVAAALAAVTVISLLPKLLPLTDTHVSTTVIITILVTSSFAFAFALITNRQREQLLHLATKDALTGAGNRRALDTKLAELVNSFKRSNEPSSIILLDLDHFKRVNDKYGHAAGDQILKSLTEIVNLRIRVTDSLYRIGGEEFVVVLDGQDLHQAAHLAEQLRTLVDANELVPDQSVTISLGVAERKAGESPNDWLHRADEALYRAKDAGRNSTSLSG